MHFFNTKGWKKVQEDKTHATMRNDVGHEIKISKQALSPKMRGEVAKLEMLQESKSAQGPQPQHLANGGEVKKQEDAFAEQERRKAAADPDVGTQAMKGREGNREPKKPEEPKKTLGNTIGYKGYAEGGYIEDPRGVEGVEPAEPIEELPETFPAMEVSPMDGVTGMTGFTGSMAPVPGSPETLQKSPQDFASEQSIKMLDTPERIPTDTYMTPVGPSPASTASPASSPTAAAPTTASTAIPNAEQTMQSGYQSQMSGLNAMAKAQADLGKAKADIAQRQMDFLNKSLEQYSADKAHLDAEVNQAVEDVRNKHIEPNRFWQQQSTFSKIATSIGIVMGGYAAGMLGGKNQALEYIEKQIDNDIVAQKAELGKAENLLSYNFKKYGNLKEATEMTKAMQMGVIAGQFEQAAANAQGPEAAARALMAVGELKAKYAPMIEKQALTATSKKLRPEMIKDPAKAEAYFQVLERIDPKKAADERERYIPGVGFSIQGGKEASDLREAMGSTASVKHDVNRLIQISKMTGKSLDLGLRSEAEVLATGLIGKLRLPLTGPGAMNEGERQMLKEVVANPTAIFSIDSNNRTKLKTLNKLMDTKVAEMFKANGLNPPQIGEKETATMNGVKYERVNGGWKKVK